MFLIINIDIIIIKRFIFGNFGKYAISDCLFRDDDVAPHFEN